MRFDFLTAWARRSAREAESLAGADRQPSNFLYPMHNPVLRSIRPVIVLICVGGVLLTVLLWVATFQTIASERSRAITAAVRENRNTSIAYEQYVARTLDAADLAAVALAEHFRDLVPVVPGRAPVRIEDAVAKNPLFASVAVVDANGNVRATTLPGVPAMNLANEPAFRAFRSGTQPRDVWISSPRMSSFAHRPLMSISRPIRRGDGSFGGGIVVRIPVERLTDFNEGAAIRPLDLISVIRLDGMTLARREGLRVSYGQDLKGRLVMRHQRAYPDGTYLGPSSIDGIWRYFSHRRLARYGLFVTVGVGQSDVLAEVQARARQSRLAMAGITLAIFAFAAFAIAGLLRRQRAALDLAAANERLREAQRIGRIGDWEYDLRSDRLILSDQLCEMYGRDPSDDLVGPDEALAHLDEANREILLAAFNAAVDGKRPESCEVVARMPDGGISYRRVRIVPQLTPEGEVRTLLGTEQNVTSEKINQQLRDEVAHMSRVEAMNVMAATIAHELSQPLTAASNYVAAVRLAARQRADADPAMLALLAKASEQIGLTSKIMARARDMVANGTAGEHSALLSEIVEDAIALVKVVNGDNAATLIERLDPDVPRVAADKVQIQQVLLNLLRNACEAAAGRDAPQVVVSSRREANNMVRICVEDNGPGIAADLGDIFSPFASSKRAGLGLGLSICRAIVDSYGGRIWSEAGRPVGAAVCFTLPALD
ncbi:ATP-binding protein [Sphingomonas sp. dw_22]|uniref:ATP-binding protein n=1 Tax=Sphingomonas sp. dw_22 TaxID=2721175 RepID=UPI001BD4B073|nr:ATP-binding protein [Sphingomonas sp. dw_22]